MAADTPNSTNRFELDGVFYETPEFQDLTIEDWELVYDEAKIAISDFAALDDPPAEAARIERLKNPRVEKAFLMIGYLRANPDQTVDDARTLTAKMKLVSVLEASNPDLADADGADDPTSAANPDGSSTKNSDESGKGSSPDSSKNSETRAAALAITGTSG